MSGQWRVEAGDDEQGRRGRHAVQNRTVPALASTHCLADRAPTDNPEGHDGRRCGGERECTHHPGHAPAGQARDQTGTQAGETHGHVEGGECQEAIGAL